jgi:hypothetical protein
VQSSCHHYHVLKYLSNFHESIYKHYLEKSVGEKCFINIGSITTTLYAKAIPLQAWTGPESSRELRLPDFKTIGT